MINLKYRRLFMGLPIENLLRTTGTTYGNNEYRVVGQQSDFSEYKPYERGDALKDVDWKVYARREKVYVKRFSSEHAKNVYLFVDTSKSMDVDFYGQKSLKKKALLEMLSYFMDYLMMHKERFTLSYLDDPNRPDKVQVDSVSLMAGQKAFHQARELITCYEPYGEIDLKQEMAQACETVEPNSNVFIFSDFYVEFEDVLAIKNLLMKKRSHLHLMHLIDKDELTDKTRHSDVDWVLDSETNEKILFDWNRQLDIYQKIVAEHIGKYYKYSLQEQIDHHPLETSMNPLNLFIGLFNK